MANTEDLRYVRTEKAIRSAFMELVSEGPVGLVSASNLCRRAGISRNAFYLHYSGIPALYGTLVDELVADIRKESTASAGRLRTYRVVDDALPSSMLGALSKHERLLRALLPSDDGTLAKRLAEGIEAAYFDAAQIVSRQGGSFENRINSAFAAWALVGLIVRWVSETEAPLSDSLQVFERLQAGILEMATTFLTSDDSGAMTRQADSGPPPS